MKFNINTANKLYTKEDGKEMRCLEKLGFSFEPVKVGFIDCLSIVGTPQVEMNNMSELMDFIKKYGEVIVRKTSLKNGARGQITIYNDYME